MCTEFGMSLKTYDKKFLNMAKKSPIDRLDYDKVGRRYNEPFMNEAHEKS